MKLDAPSESSLSHSNLAMLQKDADKPLKATPYYDLLRALADMFDDIAAGKNVFATMGCKKDRSEFVLKFDLNGKSTYINGDTLAALGPDAGRLV